MVCYEHPYTCYSSYPTSIITRIETLLWLPEQSLPIAFLPHFHYNKDWNQPLQSERK